MGSRRVNAAQQVILLVGSSLLAFAVPLSFSLPPGGVIVVIAVWTAFNFLVFRYSTYVPDCEAPGADWWWDRRSGTWQPIDRDSAER